MNMSYDRSSALPGVPVAPVTAFQYRDMSVPALPRIKPPGTPEPEVRPRAEVELTEAELAARLQAARSEGATAAEARLRDEYARKAAEEAARISSALNRFEAERKSYFSSVETEVVRLALSIAAKILHREAQVDPLLVAALVQLALNQLQENTGVQVRVHPDDAAKWRAHFAAASLAVSAAVVEDPTLERGDCLLETELGAANYSIAAQLKEVEQGFFDVLAQTPRE